MNGDQHFALLIRLMRERDEARAALEAAPAAARLGANGDLANGKRGVEDMEEDTEPSAAKRVCAHRPGLI